MGCANWQQTEEKRKLTICRKFLSRWYGCPRMTSRDQWMENVDDAWFARREVNEGIMGWEYDVCCNDQNLETTSKLTRNGYCENCQFNPGADFCIKSVPLACIDEISREIHYTANQCCYSGGKIMSGGTRGRGTMQLAESTPGNIANHLEADLEPFKSCCIEDQSPESCEIFYKYRPSIYGPYWSRIVRPATGDPHITTIDNRAYTFNGLDVYTFLRTNLSDPTEVQVSTRVSGNGTLFSGLTVQHKSALFECFIFEDGNFTVVIDNVPIELHKFNLFTVSNITIMEKPDGHTFIFFFREVELIFKIILTDSFLNIFTSVPPTFHGHMKGLLGFYDGNSTNDFLTPGSLNYFTNISYVFT